jgi:hypothetical protein
LSLPGKTMPFFELSRAKRVFFRVWLIVLIVLFVIAVWVAIFKRSA